MTKQSHSIPTRELERFRRTREVDGVLVKVRCFLVPDERPHYEIHLTGSGERAVVDVPVDRESQLPTRIAQAVNALVATIKLRNGHV